MKYVFGVAIAVRAIASTELGRVLMSVRSKRSVKDGTRGGCRGITRVFAAFAMVLGSVVALQSPAAAAPGNLKDIDVAHVSGSVYVAAGLTKGGTLQVQPMVCAYQQATCSRQGWSTVGSGVAYAEIHNLTNDMVLLVARLNDGRTFYRRGSCEGVRCTWYSWYSLGGNVISVRAAKDGSYTGCVTIAGLSPKRTVFEARVCDDARDYGWKSLGGKLKQIAVDSGGNVFGVTSNYTLWWHQSGREYSGSWIGGGGRISSPVQDNGNDHYCGLSSSRQMWCFNKNSFVWTNARGYWRKLDDGQSIGISRNWSLWGKTSNDYLSRYGGSVNQVAWDEYLQVGVSGGLTPWYRFNRYSDNTWHSA